ADGSISISVGVRGAAAQRLRQRRAIDAGAQLILEPGQIFAKHVVGRPAPHDLDDAFLVSRVRLEFRRGDIGDAKDDPFAGLVALGAAEGVLGGVEDRTGHRRRDAPRRLAALDLVGLFDGEIIGLGNGLEPIAALELVEEIGRLGLEAGGDLVLAPARLAWALDFLERAIARRRDAGHGIPDVAAIGLDRVVVDAHVGTKRGLYHTAEAAEIGERLFPRVAGGGVGLGGGHRHLQLLRRLFERAAAGALVLDLVVDVPYLGLGAFGDDVLAYLRRDVGKRFVLCGLDLGDGHDGRAEAALDRRAYLALLKRERGVGDGWIKDVRLGRHAKVEVLRLEPALGSERRETQALLEPGVGGLGLLHGREDDLLDVPLLRSDVTAAVLVEGAFDLLVGYLDPLAEFGGRAIDGDDLAVLRRLEHDLARLEILIELVRSRLRNLARLRRPQRHIFDAALLVLVLIDRVEPGFRHRHVAGDRAGDLPARTQPPRVGA